MERVRVDPVRVLIGLVLCAYGAALVSGVLTFTVWSQITVMAEEGVGLADLEWRTQAHALRYTLILPIIRLAELIGQPLDTVFTWVVGLVMLGTAAVVDRTRSLVSGEVRLWRLGRLGVYATFLGLTAVMNGRLSFAFLGMALLLWVLVRRGVGLASNLRTVVWFPLVLWLASVSSGTFTVALGTMLVWTVSLAIARYPVIRARDVALLALLLFGALALAPLLQLYINKNVQFYGGGFDGFFNMLNHGPGRFISQIGPEIVGPLASIVLGLGAVVVLAALTRARRLAPPVASVTVAAAVGVFGYSTLLMGLPGLVVILLAQLTPRRYRPVSRTA